MRRKWGTPAQRRWMKIASELPTTHLVICGYHEEGWEQTCGTAMHWRIVLTPKTGQAKCLRVKRIEYICQSCGSHFIDDCAHREYDESIRDLVFEQYKFGFLKFAHHDPEKVGHL